MAKSLLELYTRFSSLNEWFSELKLGVGKGAGYLFKTISSKWAHLSFVIFDFIHLSYFLMLTKDLICE